MLPTSIVPAVKNQQIRGRSCPFSNQNLSLGDLIRYASKYQTKETTKNKQTPPHSITPSEIVSWVNRMSKVGNRTRNWSYRARNIPSKLLNAGTASHPASTHWNLKPGFDSLLAINSIRHSHVDRRWFSCDRIWLHGRFFHHPSTVVIADSKNLHECVWEGAVLETWDVDFSGSTKRNWHNRDVRISPICLGNISEKLQVWISPDSQDNEHKVRCWPKPNGDNRELTSTCTGTCNILQRYSCWWYYPLVVKRFYPGLRLGFERREILLKSISKASKVRVELSW